MDGGHKKLPGVMFNVPDSSEPPRSGLPQRQTFPGEERISVLPGYLGDIHSEVATAPLWEEARAALRLVAKALDRWRFACQQASHSGFVADPWETSMLANSGPLVLGYSLASKLPTAASWHDPWETRLLANSGSLVLGYSLAGKLPTATSWQIRGRPACWRIPALWCWDIRLPASFPQRLRGMIRGRPACWRIPALWCWDIRLPASFPQRLRGRSVGDQLAGEFRPSGVGIFACRQASHSGFVA